MRRFKSALLLAIFTTALATISAQTGNQTDLSGTWKMNAARSRWPKASKVQSEILVIKQNGPEMEFRYDTDGKQSVENYTADKKEKAIYKVPQAGSKMVGKSYWKGSTFVVETRVAFDMSSPVGAYSMMHTKDSWTLSGDGLVLTEKSVWDDGQSVTVFDKQ